jgi:tetratricopeptide (TPR) repeat protein
VYYRLARYTEALKAILEANEQLPEDDVVLEHLGDVYRALGNFEAAAEAYRKALEISPDNPDIPAKLDALTPN